MFLGDGILKIVIFLVANYLNMEEIFKYLKRRTLERLQEFYIKYDFNWVDDFVDDLYSDLSNNEFDEKYGFVKVLYESSSKNKLVLSASFNEESKKYIVILNKTLLISDPEDKYKESLKIEIKQCLVHEDTHRQQSQGDSSKRKHLDPDKVSSYEYLSVPQEIDARAREIGKWFEDQNFNITDVFEKIEKNDVDTQFEDVIAIYQEIGGSIYHKFLSEVYRYLINEENF